MGCCCCCCRLCGGFEVNEDVEGQDRESLSDMKRLGLSRDEINTFYRAFLRVDRRRQGCFKITELLDYLKIDASPFTQRVFGELDLSTDGMLNFREFTLSSWLFCARRREGIADMAFTMYDCNNSGDLTTNEISGMVKECYGQLSDEHNIWTILDSFDADGDSKVSRTEFVIMCKKQPALLAPAITFHKRLMALISTNKNFWNRIYMSSGRTMQSKKVKMMFRVPGKIDSFRSEMVNQNGAQQSNHVKGFSCDNNLGLSSKPNMRRGKDKWKVDTSTWNKPKKQRVVVHNRDYGLFDDG